MIDFGTARDLGRTAKEKMAAKQPLSFKKIIDAIDRCVNEVDGGSFVEAVLAPIAGATEPYFGYTQAGIAEGSIEHLLIAGDREACCGIPA